MTNVQSLSSFTFAQLTTALFHHPIARITSALMAAMAITCALFLLMNMLIVPKDIQISLPTEEVIIDVNLEEPTSPPPPGPKKPEPMEKLDLPHRGEGIPVPEINPVTPPTSDRHWGNPTNTTIIETPNPEFNDGDMILISQIPPTYPGPMQRRGEEGYVVVEFTVTETGAVSNPKVLETSNRSFNKSALTAIGNFKYKPRVIDGKPRPVSGVIYKFTFRLEK